MKKGGKKGILYKFNYDIIFKWMGYIFTGETLEVLGISTGEIVEVRGLDPITLQAKEERVDLLLKDEQGNFYQIEEERDFNRQDLSRFAAQHFLITEQIGSKKLTSVIVASGKVTPETSIQTPSGSFSPVIINLNERDGEKKFEELKQQEKPNIAELVFLPMYGVERGKRREFTRKVLLYAKELCDQRKIALEILGALVILCNKIIPPEALEVIWKELSMLQIFKTAGEVGKKEGKKEKAEEMATKMLKKGMEIPLIVELTELSEEEVLKLKKELEKES